MSSVAREWREVPGRYNLKGTKCTNCGTIYFPRRDFCPKCRRAGIGKIEEYDICRTGEVYTFSIVYDAPAMCDMIKPSFIPPPAIRHLRDLVRYRRHQYRDTRHRNDFCGE